MTKNGEKWRIFTEEKWFEKTSGEFLGMYELDFSCSSIFHQLWTHIGYFKGKKVWLIFHPISAPFSPPGRLPNATTTPWKWFLRVPWWNTFQWDLREPPKPFLEKKYFRPEIPNPLSQPSVHRKFANDWSQRGQIWGRMSAYSMKTSKTWFYKLPAARFSRKNEIF